MAHDVLFVAHSAGWYGAEQSLLELLSALPADIREPMRQAPVDRLGQPGAERQAQHFHHLHQGTISLKPV